MRFISVGLFCAAAAPAFVGADGEDYYYGNQGNNGGEDYYYYGNQGGQSNVNSQYGQGGYDVNQYGQYNDGNNGYNNNAWNATNSNGTMYGFYNGGQNDANYGGNQNNDVQNNDGGDNMYDYQDPEGDGNGGAWINGKFHRFCPDNMQLEYNVDGSRKKNYNQYQYQNDQNHENYAYQQYGNQQYGNQQQDGNQQYGNQQYGNQQYGNQQYGNQQYGNQQYGNQYGDDEDYDYSECVDYRTYTPTENCRQGIITVKSVDIKCDSPYTFYYGNNAHRQSELCDYGDKALVTVYFDNEYDLPEDKPIYWTMGVYARKSELELLWAGRNINLCDSMVGHECTKAGNYAFAFHITLDWNGMSDRSLFHPVVEMGFSTQDDEGYDLGGVNIDCIFDRNYRPYNPWYSKPSIWGAGYKVTGAQGFLMGALIAAAAGGIYAFKKYRGQIRMPWDKKTPLADDEIYTSESGKIAEA